MERGESSTSARAVCCVASRGERRSGERGAAVCGRRCGEAAPPSPTSAAARARSTWSVNAPRAAALAGTPTEARNACASRATRAAPAAPSAS
eukprot:4728676-Pleurochrysis_carterae.AAC.2